MSYGSVTSMSKSRLTPYAPEDRALERALVVNFLVHGLAIASMAFLLLPMLPGGPTVDDVERVQLIAGQPWRFRIGWLPWQLCAVVDIWFAIAMFRVRWLPRASTLLVLVLTVVAVVPDQYAQGVWVTRGVALAQQDTVRYLALEGELFQLTSGWGACAYTLAALGWTVSFARAGTWSRALTWLSVPLWSSLMVAAISPLLPPERQPSSTFIAGANAVGFIQLQLWLGLVAEQVLRRSRPFENYGRLAYWRHPGSGLLARSADAIANSRLLRALLEPLRALPMKSDIRDVVYVNYLVPHEDLEPLLPEGLKLQRLGAEGRYALFTFLTYNHGHFGLAFLGPLRRLFPSPTQSNWRIYVREPRTKRVGVYFVTNAITHLLQAFGARLLAEGMPMHAFKHASVQRADDGGLRMTLEPGSGSAPDARGMFRPCSTPPQLVGPWAECWPDFDSFLAYCVPQDLAISSQPLRQRVTSQEIHLGIPLDACLPLRGAIDSRSAERIVGDAQPLCFYVPSVSFYFAGEEYDDLESSGGSLQ